MPADLYLLKILLTLIDFCENWHVCNYGGGHDKGCKRDCGIQTPATQSNSLKASQLDIYTENTSIYLFTEYTYLWEV